MGEAKKRAMRTVTERTEPMVVDTPGGRIHVQWAQESSATPNGQLTFFAEFLHTAGLYESWVQDCPLYYTSPNAPTKYDVLGTLLLSILAGHNRYAHITALRSDGVSPEILKMNKIISEDAMRRGLARIDAPASEAWLKSHLLCSVSAALNTPWILDIDTTIKTLFGKQQGAEVGYNPQSVAVAALAALQPRPTLYGYKPGRPSHALHTYWVGNLRLVLDVVVSPGKQTSASHAQPGLKALLDGLTPNQRPAMVRGDCGFGNEPFIAELEARNQPYLFKLRQTKGIHKLLQRQFQREDWTLPGANDQGWSAVEDTVKLSGWDHARRVVILRRAVKQDVALTRRVENQLKLWLKDEATQAYEYAVLVTNAQYDLQAIAQLYRDRADCENGFDELKNQWGWGGFSTQDIERCQTSARSVALIYTQRVREPLRGNWWSWYCRAAKPDARMEAITSRPLLLAGVGRAVKHAGQCTLYLTAMHAAGKSLIALVSNIRLALAHVKMIAEQLPMVDRWHVLLNYIVSKITRRPPPIYAKLFALEMG